jgi:hypothetical protein
VSSALEVGRALLDMLGSAVVLKPEALFHPDAVDDGDFVNRQAFFDRASRATADLALVRDRLVGTTTPTDVPGLLDRCSLFGVQEALIERDDEPTLADRAKSVSAIVDTRVSAAEALLARDPISGALPPLDRIAQAFAAIFGEAFVALPTIDVSSADNAAAFDGLAGSAAPKQDRVWLWLRQAADTHARVHKLEAFHSLAEAWSNDAALAEHPAVARPRVAQLPADAGGWQALSDTELATDGPRPKGCLSIVALTGEAPNMSCLAGFMIDEWTETIPDRNVATGVSFEYNQPSAQAPHCFLLAVPGNFEEKLWTPQHLAEIVRDTIDLAKVRLVDLDALPEVAGVFPALMFPIAAPPKLRLQLKLPLQNDRGNIGRDKHTTPSHALSSAD